MNTYPKMVWLSFIVIVTVLVINNCSKEENPVIPVIPDDPALILIYPVGGETMQAETTVKIKWSSTNIDSISIHLSTNSGIDWTEIVSSVSTEMGEWDWITPNSILDSCKIKIVSKSDVSINDESDSNFSIFVVIPTPELDLLLPNGGELWLIGDTENITWTSENVNDIKIEFSSDNGTYWSSIIDSIPSTGTYSWIVSAPIPSSECLIRISDISDSTVYDESNSSFSIYVVATLELLTPNGGEVWESFTDYFIIWTSENIDKIDIAFTSDDGISWNTIDSSVAASTEQYVWETPSKPSDYYKIKLTFSQDNTINDESDGNFSIVVASWITESLDYYPLAVGNKWVYDTIVVDVDSITSVTKVIGVQNLEGKYNFILRHIDEGYNDILWYHHIDSTTGIVTETHPNGYSHPLLGLAASAGDTIFYNWGEFFTTISCTSEGIDTIFGQSTHSKMYEYYEYFGELIENYKYSKSFGRTWWEFHTMFFHVFYTLKGCVIDGVVYGDTTFQVNNLNKVSKSKWLK